MNASGKISAERLAVDSGSVNPLNAAVRAALYKRVVVAAGAGLLAVGMAGVAAPVMGDTFPSVIDLSSLDGTNGFVFTGVSVYDTVGRSVSGAVDFNGDGIDDVIVGAFGAAPGYTQNAGETYVIFGSDEPFPATMDRGDLDGATGVILQGIDAFDSSGISVSGAGDVNGDEIDDVVIGAQGASPNNQQSAGESYVVFGSDGGFPAAIDLATLDGSNGFVLNGIDSFDNSGQAVSGAGDVNDDGLDDVIVGAWLADPGGFPFAGEGYVVFGSDAVFPAALNLSTLDGTNGFTVVGVDSGDYAGGSVSAAGDINGDGIDDFAVGAYGGDPGGRYDAGESYVVFGNDAGFPASLNLASLDGDTGFVLNGIAAGSRSGGSVSNAGDVNGDGFDDLVIGAFKAMGSGTSTKGQAYVLFGRDSGFPASLQLFSLDGTNGFALTGIDFGDWCGWSVSGAGDVNNDGIDDLILGAPRAAPGGDAAAGESYVVFGSRDSFPAEFDLSTLDGSNGFTLQGIDPGDETGHQVSGVGDVNGDGVDDMVVAARYADPMGVSYAGEAYVVFGRAAVADTDGDGVTDDNDNCTLIANADQRDTDGDLIGNACDADLNGDCTVNFGDLAQLKAAFFPNPYVPDPDFNGDGSVNFGDLAFMKSSFFNSPTPGPGPGAPGNACE